MSWRLGNGSGHIADCCLPGEQPAKSVELQDRGVVRWRRIRLLISSARYSRSRKGTPKVRSSLFALLGKDEGGKEGGQEGARMLSAVCWGEYGC